MTDIPTKDALAMLRQCRSIDGAVELLIKQSRNRQWSLAAGVMETATGQEHGCALRVVLRDGRSSLVTMVRPGDAGLAHAVERAHQLAGAAHPDPHLTLPGPPPENTSPMVDGTGPATLSGEEAARALLERLQVPETRTARVAKAWLHHAEVSTELANTLGFAGSHRCSMTILGVLLAGSGADPLVHEELFTGSRAPDARRFLDTALARASALFGSGTEAPGSPGTLVLTPEAAAPLLAALGSRFVPRPDMGTVPVLPTPGTRVARAGITLVDDGRHPGGPRSAPFDGEGTTSVSTVLVQDGILQTLVHDRRSASLAGTVSTGNAVRDSYRQWPAPGLTTLALLPRPDLSEDDLLGDITRGLCAVDAAPPDPDRLEAGIFSIRFRGRLIRGGRLRSPARPVIFRIPVNDLLPSLRAAAGRPRLIALDGGVNTPLLRLDGVRLESC